MPDSAIERELSRRGFLTGVGGGVLALSGLAQTLSAASAAAEALAQRLPGVGLSPDDPAVRRTISAYVDTIVPGPAGGADRHPGALEAGAVAEVYDPFYGIVGTLPLLHRDLQLSTARVLRRPARFDLALPYRDRERVVLDRLTAPGEGGPTSDTALLLLYAGVAIVAYVTYYGTARSRVGPRYIGFPPESSGYWPHHSYRLHFRGMTRDGNPR